MSIMGAISPLLTRVLLPTHLSLTPCFIGVSEGGTSPSS